MQIGIDLVQINDLVESNLDPAKIYTPNELSANPSKESLSGIFAAKEAFFKALGRKEDWLSVWIEKEPSGKPKIFSNLLNNTQRAEVSITHTSDYAVAVVIIYQT